MIEEVAETSRAEPVFNKLFTKILAAEDLTYYDLTWKVSLLKNFQTFNFA